jgi:hypothetical protein
VELRGAVGGQVVGEPLEIRHPVCTAGHNAEQLIVEPHDRQVLLERPARGQQRRIDDAADRHVHLPHRDVLDDIERRWAGDVEDRKRRQVDHGGAIAHREVLRRDDRRPPARLPLRLAAADAVAVLVEQAGV